jgi:hypothetical protein
MDEKVVYEREAESKLRELDDRIQGLKARAKDLEGKAKKGYHDRVEKLLLKKNEVEDDLKKMKDAGAGAWGDIKTGIDKAFEEIDQGFKSAVSRLKKKKEPEDA